MTNTALHKQNGPKSWFLALICMNHYFVSLQDLPTLTVFIQILSLHVTKEMLSLHRYYKSFTSNLSLSHTIQLEMMHTAVSKHR